MGSIMRECFIYRKDKQIHMAKNPLIPILGLAGVAAITMHQLDAKAKPVTMPFSNLSAKSPTQLEIEELERQIAELQEENEELGEPEKYLPEQKWLPNELQGQDFRKMLKNEVEPMWNPFVVNQSDYGGEKTWENADTTLKLIDDDCVACWLGCCDVSGWMKLVVKPNYRVILNISTENYNYFHEAVTNAYGTTLADFVKEQGREEENTWGWTNNSSVRVALYGKNDYNDSPDGDYLSIDIDSEKSGVAEFALRTGGVQFDTDENPDDEVYVQLVDVAYINPDYDPTLLNAEDTMTFNAKNPSKIAAFFRRLGTAIKGIGRPAASVSDDTVGLARIDGAVSVGGEIGTGSAKVTEVAGIVPDAIGDVADAGYAGRAFVNGAEGVTETGGKITVNLNDGWGVVRKSDGVVQTGRVVINKGDTIIKYSGRLDDVGGGAGFFGRLGDAGVIKTARGLGVGTLYLGAAGAAWVIYQTAKLLPEEAANAARDFGCSITGQCCEESCAESQDPDCVKECREAAKEKSLMVGGLVVAGILGIALIFKGKSTSKEAEGYYRIVEV
tara:strand:- start:2271 stop:3941 length:1671 start_codon:yes stop_codon:yes gene_type:complete